MASEYSLLDAKGQLPDDLREEAALALQKVGAYLGSHGDPNVMKSFKEPPGLMGLFYLTAMLGIFLWIIAEIGNYYEIVNNWAHYRCTPSVGPFSKFYGHDLNDTMSFCIGEQVKEHAGGVITPIYKGISEVQSVIDKVVDKVEAVEGGIMGLLKGFESFVVNFVNSFRLLGTRVRMSFIRIKEIFARVYGIFIAFSYAAISAITFGENLVCNPLVTFVAGFAGVDICCFAAETHVQMADGSALPITKVQIGDCLADGQRVTACFEFDGRQTAMVNIQGAHVSTNHSVLTTSWIAAGDHPDAIPVPSRERIWCLNTTTNTIPIIGDTPLTFTDYEESSAAEIVAEAQAAAERELNGSLEQVGPTVADYGLGLDPNWLVLLNGSRWSRIADLVVGDRLSHGASVRGVVRELCQDVRLTPAGLRVAAAQLIDSGKSWVRAATCFTQKGSQGSPAILCQLFLSTNEPFTVTSATELLTVRDYQEWQGAAVQEPYDRYIGGERKLDCSDPKDNRDNKNNVVINPNVLATKSHS